MMKKTVLLAITLLFGSTLSIFAQGTVSSVNAAGYIKVDTEGGKFYFVQNPFTKFDNSTSFTLSEVVGDTLPDSSQAFVWDAVGQQFSVATYFDGFGWFPDAPVERGQGFFVRPADGAPATSVFLHGQVPGATTFNTTQVDVVPGYSAIGWPYPVEVTVTDSGLAAVMEDSDQVFGWDAATQSFQISTYFDGFGFFPDLAIAPGSAVYVSRLNAASSASFSATPGYTWPNN